MSGFISRTQWVLLVLGVMFIFKIRRPELSEIQGQFRLSNQVIFGKIT